MKMDYFNALISLLSQIQVTTHSGKHVSLDTATTKIVDTIIAASKKGGKVILIGNGGSASIASHMVTDFLKNARIPALAFNDPSLITCISNDLGYEYVFERPIELLAKKGDILFAISSSGKSKNILNAVKKARDKGCFIVTLSGFHRNNPLKKIGEVNFYASSHHYGEVEISHLSVIHSIIDKIINKNH